MLQVKVRVRAEYPAFQWDGSDVEAFPRMEGVNAITGEPYNVLAVHSGFEDEHRIEFAKPGDWIVTGIHGNFIWPAAQFDTIYEIVG